MSNSPPLPPSRKRQQCNCYFAAVEQMWSPNDMAEFYFQMVHIFKLGERMGLDIYGQQSSCCTETLPLSTSWNRQQQRSGALFWRGWLPRPSLHLEKAPGIKCLLVSCGLLIMPFCFPHNGQSCLFQPRWNHVLLCRRFQWKARHLG